MAAEKLRVLLATTWGIPCGIAEHAAMLKAAVEAADPRIAILPEPLALDPHATDPHHGEFDVLHLNYHAALHSRWQPENIRRAAEAWPVLTTYHDSGVPNSDHCKAVVAASTAAVVHEPFDDLPFEKTWYWRMGVPASQRPWAFYESGDCPLLGTVGFPFPWKCYDELCRVTAANGWGLLLLTPTATETDGVRWRGLNPRVEVVSEFLSQPEVVSRLAGCDATAFTYVTHNTGQSGAILQGIAARKPVIALRTCRQFRALYEDWLGRQVIGWCETFDEVAEALRTVPVGLRFDAGIVALAEQESWSKVGMRYARLYRDLAAGRRS